MFYIDATFIGVYLLCYFSFIKKILGRIIGCFFIFTIKKKKEKNSKTLLFKIKRENFLSQRQRDFTFCNLLFS